ncbi:hypothetical protein Zmor_018421 [Zophobas morio]|uniref:Uncharacterized protein n=1 Tax=Zophobas morio TaxID=2755281 RepID=A0AA38MD07_9CUCU|nr:hypothetical protein Zmor_018421 [Zophobas morio]
MEFSRVLLLTVFYSFTCTGARNNNWDDWAQNLNRDIQQRVRQSLSGLDNLGSTISQQVQQNLAGINPSVSNSANYANPRGTVYEHEVYENTPQATVQFNKKSGGFGNLGSLDNLGSTISQQVYEGLRPVREMQAKLKIKFGEDGTTVATFKDKQVIVRDGVFYKCEGTISEEDGSCSGTLRKSSFESKKDFCYANINTIINNWYCISSGGGVSSGIINGNMYCNGFQNNPTLLISREDYRNLCGNVGYPVTYKYFGTHPIGDHSSDVRCSGGTPYTCTYTEDRNPRVPNFTHTLL